MKKLPALFQPSADGGSSAWTGRSGGGMSGGSDGMAQLAVKLDAIGRDFTVNFEALGTLTAQSITIQEEISDDIEDVAANIGHSTKLTDELLKSTLNTEKLAQATYKLHKQHYDWLKRKSIKDDLAAEEDRMERRRNMAGQGMGGPAGMAGVPGGPGDKPPGGSGGLKGGLWGAAAAALAAGGTWAWNKLGGPTAPTVPTATPTGAKPPVTSPAPQKMTPAQLEKYKELRKQNVPALEAKKIATETTKKTAGQAIKAGASQAGKRALALAGPAAAVASAGLAGWEVGTAINEHVLSDETKDTIGKKIFGAMSYIPGTEAWEMTKDKDPNLVQRVGGSVSDFFGGFGSKAKSNIEKRFGGSPAATKVSGDDDIKAMIKAHEGLPKPWNRPYKDSRGYWTVGYGHLITKDSALPPEWNREFSADEINNLFEQDYAYHKKAAEKMPGFDKLNKQGQAAMIDLAFNMGPNWYKSKNAGGSGFVGTAAAIARGDMEGAAQGLENSDWYDQVKSRAPKIVAMVRSGGDGSGPTRGPSMVAAAPATVGGPAVALAPAAPPRVDSVVAGSAAVAQSNVNKAPVVVNNVTNVTNVASAGNGSGGASRALASPFATRGSLDQGTTFVAGASALA